MKKIIFQGDSITDANSFNTTNQLGEGYVSMLDERLTDFVVINHGISGNRLPEIINRINETIEALPDMLFILVGINEIWHKYIHGKDMTTERFKNNYEQLLTQIRTKLPDTKICLMEPFGLPLGHFTDNWIPDLLAEQRVVYELSFKYHTGFIPTSKNYR